MVLHALTLLLLQDWRSECVQYGWPSAAVPGWTLLHGVSYMRVALTFALLLLQDCRASLQDGVIHSQQLVSGCLPVGSCSG
jgi:hypothetical protein